MEMFMKSILILRKKDGSVRRMGCAYGSFYEDIKTDVFPEGFIDKEKIRVVYEDSNHDLYFFPDKGALFISDLSMTTFRRLPPGTPLEGNDGMFVIEDNEKWLWFGTNNGLIRYDKKDNFIPYNFVDGIPSPNFYPLSSCT